MLRVTFPALLLFIVAGHALVQDVLDSADVGVQKCEFQGQLGQDRVRLYVFLTACVDPSPLDNNISTNSSSSNDGSSNEQPNFFLSGSAFMLLLDRPVTTTQHQQPLGTLLWAAHNQSKDTAAEMEPSGGVASAPRVIREALLEAARRLAKGTDQILAVRSLWSGKQYGIRLSYREPENWIINPSLRREPGRLSAEISLDPAELYAVAGSNSNLNSGSIAETDITVRRLLRTAAGNAAATGSSVTSAAAAPAFEVLAAGFEGACAYTPMLGNRRPLAARKAKSPSSSSASAGASSADPGDTAAPGAPACAWLDPDRIAYDNNLFNQWRAVQKATVTPASTKGSKRWRHKGWNLSRGKVKVSPPPPPPPPSPPPPVSSSAPPAYMVVSSYFNLDPYDFITLLRHHIEYHAALGVQRHLVYIEEGEEALAADPRVTALVAAGRLEVVRWRELPAFPLPGSSGGVRHPYANQILIYQHALLTLWHEAAVVAVADLDEFLLTSQPLSLELALLFCSPRGSHPPGALWVPRRAVLCTTCLTAAAAEAAVRQSPAGDAAAAAATGPTSRSSLVSSRQQGILLPARSAASSSSSSSSPQPLLPSWLRPRPQVQVVMAQLQAGLRNATLAAAAAALERALWLTDSNSSSAAAAAAAAAAAVSTAANAAGGDVSASAAAPFSAGSGTPKDSRSRSSSTSSKMDASPRPANRYQHPLEHYRHWREGWHHKSLLYSHVVSYFGVHMAFSGDPRVRPHTISRSGCAVWAHVETQLGPRGRGGAGSSNAAAGSGGAGSSSQSETTSSSNRNGVTGSRSNGNGGGGSGDGGGGREVRVTAVEQRYYWALERVVGRPIPRVQYKG
ncbi:hypothetical protein Agub_g13025 [Astrephomene gubernaculifera]|uniref:Glycosyltransferase family 92 protein n=1 Tax=Astrephomene gubernaculifera TaxID=47775 RepID=A0AAD3DZL8_9CHLO|nr:hypothetical protein Agub_g13025 [Astrephomene gubernaculifera]